MEYLLPFQWVPALLDAHSLPLFTLHQSVAQNLSDMWLCTNEMALRSFAPLQKSRRNRRCYVSTEALSGMISVPTV